MRKMRRGCIALASILIVISPVIAAAEPISLFPSPFVKAGTIFTENGTSTMAIIIGDRAASVDMIGAAMLALKISSHLYYKNAPYVSIEDAEKHGIALYYGGFSANEYNISKTTLSLVGSSVGPNLPPPDHYLYWNATSKTIGTEAVPGAIFNLGGTECGMDNDFVLAPLDNMSLYPASFPYLLGINASIDDAKGVVYDNTTGRFYMNTGLIELSEGKEINIPWLGFKLVVKKVDATAGYAATLLVAPDGTTVAYLNLSNWNGFAVADFVFNPDDPANWGDPRVVATGDYHIKDKGHKGVPEFRIDMTSHPEGNWILLPDFKVILANFTSADLPQYAISESIYGKYGDPWYLSIWHTGITPGWFHDVTYPAKGYALTNNWTMPLYNITYYWSPTVFPWFNGNVKAYVWDFWQTGTSFYVFNSNDTWYFNITKHIGCYDFVFTSIGNYTKPGQVTCPLTQSWANVTVNCTFICGDWAGVYKIETTEETVQKLHCDFMPDYNFATTQEKATVYPRGATGVFAGIFDRFENVTGFKGTTQIKIETSGNATYAKDVTQPADVDQVFAGEAVFSFVKMPIIYLDSWVFQNNTLSTDLANKDLILIGGPAVNMVVKYLNDAKLLDVTFKQVNGVWALEYAGKTYDLDTVLKILVDQGYLPAPISKDYVYKVEGGNGLGVIEYAKKNPFGSGQILVVAGTDRYGTLAASVALADPTKLVASTAPVFYAAGRTAPNAVILLGIMPTAIPAGVPPAVLTPVIVAIPAGAAG
jgi:hypothetical protein